MKTENHSKLALLGIKDHLAVHHTGGRIGSASGPDAFRKSFTRFKSKSDVFSQINDLGDFIPQSSDIQTNHDLASELIKQMHTQHSCSIVVGGSHDHGYTHLKGISDSFSKKETLGCINIDAHFDVRKPNPQITSGSPFYLAIENKVIHPRNFIEFGIQRHANGPELWKYIEQHQIKTIVFDEIRSGQAMIKFQECLNSLSSQCDKIVVSFDLDAVSAAFAPGVSAPQAEGLSSSEAIHMAEVSAKNKKVCSFGIFELNPLHDTDQKTQLLAATMAYHFALEKFK